MTEEYSQKKWVMRTLTELIDVMNFYYKVKNPMTHTIRDFFDIIEKYPYEDITKKLRGEEDVSRYNKEDNG